MVNLFYSYILLNIVYILFIFIKNKHVGRLNNKNNSFNRPTILLEVHKLTVLNYYKSCHFK